MDVKQHFNQLQLPTGLLIRPHRISLPTVIPLFTVPSRFPQSSLSSQFPLASHSHPSLYSSLSLPTAIPLFTVPSRFPQPSLSSQFPLASHSHPSLHSYLSLPTAIPLFTVPSPHSLSPPFHHHFRQAQRSCGCLSYMELNCATQVDSDSETSPQTMACLS